MGGVVIKYEKTSLPLFLREGAKISEEQYGLSVL